jgi:hypothetical protein
MIMKITVKHKDTEIIVSENENDTKDRVTSMRWGDQNKQIQETIIVMTEQVKKLADSTQ